MIFMKFSSPIDQDPSTRNTRSALASLHTRQKVTGEINVNTLSSDFNLNLYFIVVSVLSGS